VERWLSALESKCRFRSNAIDPSDDERQPQQLVEIRGAEPVVPEPVGIGQEHLHGEHRYRHTHGVATEIEGAVADELTTSVVAVFQHLAGIDHAESASGDSFRRALQKGLPRQSGGPTLPPPKNV